jgi:hypothetical protein
LEEEEGMKILYKIVLFLMLVPMVTALINLLGAFPSGSLPISDFSMYKDEHGQVTSDSLMGYFFGSNTFHITVFGLGDFSIHWGIGTIIGIFTVTMVLAAFVLKTTTPISVGIMAIVMSQMIITSKAWWDNLTKNFGGQSFPTIVFLVTIIFFGIFYIWFITLLESHQQGDVSDR